MSNGEFKVKKFLLAGAIALLWVNHSSAQERVGKNDWSSDDRRCIVRKHFPTEDTYSFEEETVVTFDYRDISGLQKALAFLKKCGKR
jgi:hypothetical protein